MKWSLSLAEFVKVNIHRPIHVGLEIFVLDRHHFGGSFLIFLQAPGVHHSLQQSWNTQLIKLFSELLGDTLQDMELVKEMAEGRKVVSIFSQMSES